MFKTKIKFLPKRQGERYGSTMTNNNASKILKYKASLDIKDYINDLIKNH